MTRLPTFLGIGVEKAGTTSIYAYLKQHPDIFMSPIKETNFLEQDWGTDLVQTHRAVDKRVDTFEKYHTLFQDADRAIAIGEISPNYLFHYQSSIQRIQRYVPDANMIVILRDPVERAFSDYLMHLRDVISGGQPLSLADQAKYKASTSFTIRKGFYFTPLKCFIETFGADRVGVFLYDDLCSKPIEMMQQMYHFLGVNAAFLPDLSTRYQTSQIPKSRAINQLLKTQNPVRKSVALALRMVLPDTVRQRIRSRLVDWNSQKKEAVSLSVEDRKILSDLYRDDVQKLQDLIQRDLSHWLTP